MVAVRNPLQTRRTGCTSLSVGGMLVTPARLHRFSNTAAPLVALDFSSIPLLQQLAVMLQQ
jgi:hypothetical protein